MNDDNVLIVIGALILLGLILRIWPYSKFGSLVNFVVMASYSIYLLIGLHSYSSGGTGLLWIVALLISYLAHSIGLTVYLAIKWFGHAPKKGK